jgi:hypothetical protein
MRWFHVTKKQSKRTSGKELDNKVSQSKSEVNFPMKLEITHRKKRDYHFGMSTEIVFDAIHFTN